MGVLGVDARGAHGDGGSNRLGSLRGVVHQFRPYGSDQSELLELDLGSAPPVALLELVDLLAACGARTATLGTYD
jgi:hypothetical protein